MNYLMKRVIEGETGGRKDEEEDVSSYWMPIRKREDTGNLKGRTKSRFMKRSFGRDY
jgi:hypothetical protein